MRSGPGGFIYYSFILAYLALSSIISGSVAAGSFLPSLHRAFRFSSCGFFSFFFSLSLFHF